MTPPVICGRFLRHLDLRMVRCTQDRGIPAMQSGERTIAVVGTINRDTILTADGVRTES